MLFVWGCYFLFFGALNVHLYIKFGFGMWESVCLCVCVSLHIHICTSCGTLVCMPWSLYLLHCVLPHTSMSLHKTEQLRRKGEMRTERVINAPGVWRHTDFLFTFPSLEKTKEWHLSRQADCRGRLRRCYCTFLTLKLLHMQISADSRFPVERASGVCACAVRPCVSEPQEEWPGEHWILSVCDRERDNAANGCQANCHLAGLQCFL